MNNLPNSYITPQPSPQRQGVSVGWVFAALLLGFILPVCACGALIFATFAGFGSLASSLDPAADTGSGAGVGLIKLEGVIFQGSGFGASSENLLRDIDWMEANPDVRAIVVQANSPGGDANASDVIWERLSRVRKPVVIAIDGLCASGCYYIAMGAANNEIYATPNSLIGSIGVISTFFNIEELAAEIGIEVQVVATGENKDFGSLFRELTEDEIAYWQEQISVTLDTFISRVNAGRPNLNEREIRALANGRVWTASLASDLGLIDGILYPHEVLDHAADLGGITSGRGYRVIESPYTDWGDWFSFFGLEALGEGGLGVSLPNARDLDNMLQQSPIQYRYYGPYSGGE